LEDGHVTEVRDEPSGAVVAAMEIIKGLSGDNRAFPPDQLIRLFHEELTSRDLLEGFATLVCSFMGMLDEPLDLVPAVIRRLERLQLVPDEVLPTMAGGLTAAAPASVADALAARPGLDNSDDAWLRGACLVVRRLTVGRLPRLRTGGRELPPT
jgi:hypothetical protein